MRQWLLAGAAAVLVALVVSWWLEPAATTGTLSLASHSTASRATQLQAAVATNKAEQPPHSYQKAVGSHQGPPIKFPLKRAPATAVGVSREQRLKGLALGSNATINGRSMRALGARAILTTHYDSSYGPVLFTQSGFDIVALSPDDSTWDALVIHQDERPLVVNPVNQRVGIVTGGVIVKLIDVNAAAKVATMAGLELVSVDESIQVAYMRAPENYRLLEGMTSVLQIPGVVRAELEVVEANKELR